jgi:hypothetical protein
MRIPLLSATATSPTLSDKTSYPTFSRIIPSDSLLGPAVTSVIRGFGWSQFGILHGIDNFEEMVGLSVQDAANAEGLRTVTVSLDSESKTGFNIEKKLKHLQEKKMRIIVCAIIDRNSVYDNLKRVASQLGMNTSEYVWIMAGSGRLTDYFSGTLFVEPYVNKTTTEYRCYETSMLEHNQSVPGVGFGIYSPFFFDAVLVLAEAIRAMMEQWPNLGALELASDAPKLISHIRKVEVLGATGPILFDENTGDRLGSAYRLVNFQGGQWVEVGVMRMPEDSGSVQRGSTHKALPPPPSPPPGVRGAIGSGITDPQFNWIFDHGSYNQIQWPGSSEVGGLPPHDGYAPSAGPQDSSLDLKFFIATACAFVALLAALICWWRACRNRTSKTTIFISYKHKDAAFAQRIYEQLTDCGYLVQYTLFLACWPALLKCLFLFSTYTNCPFQCAGVDGYKDYPGDRLAQRHCSGNPKEHAGHLHSDARGCDEQVLQGGDLLRFEAEQADLPAHPH